MRSPIWSVGSIEPDGMKNIWATYVRTPRASTSATVRTTNHSMTHLLDRVVASGTASNSPTSRLGTGMGPRRAEPIGRVVPRVVLWSSDLTRKRGYPTALSGQRSMAGAAA